ncbi:cyp-36A1 [Pristionchus pacificus]|nr:cyp-36A1 [Pristionchus pacificus]
MDNKFVEWKKKYGRVFTIWIPYPVVVLSDHDLLQEHIVKDGDKFSDRINPKVMMDILVGGEYGLIFNDNNMWKEQRRFALHALRDVGFNNATVQNTAIDYSQEIVARWKQQGAGQKPVDLTMGVMVGVANIIWQQTFGRTLPYDDPLLERVKDLAKEFVTTMAHPAVLAMELFPSIRKVDKFIGNPIKKFIDVNNEFLALIEKELAIVYKDFNEDEEAKCFADAFIREMKRREAKGEELGTFTHIQLVGACYDLWTAGFETTVTTLRFAMHHMINHPEIQRKAQSEIDEQIGKRNIQMEDQKLLPYCNAIIQEVQRLANIVTLNFTRMINTDVTINGYSIPAGTGVIPEFSIVHMDEKEYERPEYFCPERHINEAGEFVKDPRITPFSIGKRSCLGEGLARMELFLYFTSFIQHLSFYPISRVPPALNTQISFTRSPAPYEVLIQSRD